MKEQLKRETIIIIIKTKTSPNKGAPNKNIGKTTSIK
jgi:hypothetical protein